MYVYRIMLLLQFVSFIAFRFPVFLFGLFAQFSGGRIYLVMFIWSTLWISSFLHQVHNLFCHPFLLRVIPVLFFFLDVDEIVSRILLHASSWSEFSSFNLKLRVSSILDWIVLFFSFNTSTRHFRT